MDKVNLPPKLPIPTPEDYQATIDMFDVEYAEEELHETIRGMAREFPSTMLVQLGTLARTVNPVDKADLSREYDHYDLCRALAYGAATGLMIGQTIYVQKLTVGEGTWFRKEMLQATDDEGSVIDGPVAIETGDIIDLFRAHTAETMRDVGEETEKWLQYRAERLLADADDTTTVEWYLNGAARTLFLLKHTAEHYNQL